MESPVHLDGRTFVLLRHVQTWFSNRFEVVLSGLFVHDGELLTIVDQDGNEHLVDADLIEKLATVSDANAIPACRGYDFFAIYDGVQSWHQRRSR